MRSENLCAAAPAKGCAGIDSGMQHLSFYMQNLPGDIGEGTIASRYNGCRQIGYVNKTMK